jgi:hypothetical protein
VAYSFNFSQLGRLTGDQTGTFPRNISVVMTLRRGSTVLQASTINGTYDAVEYDSELNSTGIQANFGGAFTLTDSSGGSEVEYNLALSGATGQWPLNFNTPVSTGQSLAIVSSEE